MWKAVGESVIGTSHQPAGECQDAVAIRQVQVSGEMVLVFAVSDGAGSAKHAAEAAKLSVQRFCAEVGGDTSALDCELLGCCERVRNTLLERAKELEASPRDLAATLIAGVVTGAKSWFVQIGDGAIIREKAGTYHALTWPESGEYVNTTVFLSSPEWRERAQHVAIEETVTGLAAFTDGLQELILQHSDKTVHQAFFPRMMAQLRITENPDALAEPLRAFLGSDAVNARTDDDKTLFLACRAD